MLKFTTLAFIGVCLGALPVAQGAYVIKLKNGNEFVTGRYWQEGSQLLFEADRGVFGVDRAFVTTIDKTDRPVRNATAAEGNPAEKVKTETARDENSAEKSPAESREKEPKSRDASDPILKTFADIQRRAQTLDGSLTSEVQQLAKDLDSLKKVIQLSGKSNDYLEEFKEIHDLADKVEALLKARR